MIDYTILVTGGSGYIGSHTVFELVCNGYNVIVLDNFSNSDINALKRVNNLTYSICRRNINIISGDIININLLNDIFSKNNIDSVIHFAGLKAVGESVVKPIDYYKNNISGTLNLCQAMLNFGVRNFIFSSSATVYGTEAPIPYTESQPRGTTSNPYGASKAMVERILSDIVIANPDWSVSLLRYFNPVGAHPSGEIGEDPQGTPNNLLPYITQVAIGRRDHLSVFGGDYPTPDGTCRRDYLHVMDLAKGHVAALQNFNRPGVHTYNLGTGTPYSVLEIIHAFERVNGVNIPYEIVDRRAGDLPEFWADASKAKRELGWEAKLTLEDMVRDSWNWQKKNPNGYQK